MNAPRAPQGITATHRVEADDREPDPVRQTEIERAVADNVHAGKAPYNNVRVRTRGELLRIIQSQGWTVSRDSGGRPRPNLAYGSFDEANLTGIRLWRANLSKAHFDRGSLSNAQLGESNLSGADLRGTSLANADLRGADLTRADLRGADLRGADVREARLDCATLMDETTLFDGGTRVADVVWNGAPLTRVMWDELPVLGDEAQIKLSTDRRNRVKACREAARAYRSVALELRRQGLLIPASRFRLREQRMERKALIAEGRVGAWLFSAALNIVSAYGERPGRAFAVYVSVILAFAAAYYGITTGLHTQLSQLTWDEALVLSVTSFHGRGFFPGFLDLGDWVSRLAAVEAVVGLFVELVFIATFSRRFLGN